jgi:histidinol-phosphate aminotransferase
MAIQAPSPQSILAPDFIRQCATYQPGKPIEELERELGIKDIIKLASNENPLGPSPLAMAAIREALPNLHLYPDASHFRLRQRLAEESDLDLEEVFVANGSEEVFSLLIRSFCRPGDRTVSCGAAFLAYRVMSQVHGVEYREPPLSDSIENELDQMLALVDSSTKIVFIPNPNNPTGTYLSRAQLKRTLDKLQKKGVIVLLDYAYKEYARAQDLPPPLEFYREYPNLIVTGTFSKIYGLGGLRVGYAFAHPQILEPMRKVKMPFNVSALGMAGALAALGDHEHIRRAKEVNAEGMAYLEKEFSGMGLAFRPSQGNFLLVKMPSPPVPIYENMLSKGVILRPVGGYGLKEHLRISVGTGAENKRMLESLKKTLRELNG